jgi:bacillithiol biosynthesis deacetylase BshB1
MFPADNPTAPATKDPALDVLAIAAHRDDVELTCGGTLIKMVDLGYKVGALDLTEGEMGSRGTRESREQEAQCAAKTMGLVHRENLRLPDAGVEVTRENKLKVAEVLRRLRPRVVILPYWEGRHPDHINASLIGKDACFLAGLKKLDIPGTPFRPFKILYAAAYFHITPTFVVDITDQFERRWEAVKCYKSQFFEYDEQDETFPPPKRLRDRIETRCKHFGYLIGREYGEGFIQREMLEIHDVAQIPVRSV